MQPNGAKRNKEDHAMFSNAGPNLNKPEETNKPRVTPNIYKLKNKKNNGIPKSKIDIPNKGEVSNIAGTKPIKVLTSAVKISVVIISPILIGAINKFVKFLLHISSKNNMLKLMLVLNKKSYKIAQVKITPIVLL